MVSASTKSRRHAVVRSSFILLSAALLPVLAQPACGSDDGKKKANGPRFMDGGEGGGEVSSGGTSSPGEGGAGAGGSGGTGNAGSAAGPSEGGSAGVPTSGGGGEAGGSDGPSCPDGSADCDDDPSDCETDVTEFEECGACGVACQSVNGTTICGEVDGRTGCEVTSCTTGYGDCNDTGTDGCESPLNTADNCGFCDRDCGEQACNAQTLCDASLVGAGSNGAYRWARTSDALYRLTGSTPSYGLASNYVVTRTPLNGGAEVIMHSDAAKSPGGLAVDDTHVYWAVNGTPAGVLRKAHNALAGDPVTPVFETPSIPVQMQIRGGYLYYTTAAGSIFRRAMSEQSPSEDGDEIVTAAEVKGTGTFQMHQDFVTTPTALYWVVTSTGNQGFIRTAPIAGGTASDVGGGLTNEYLKLSVVGEDLYWVRATGSAFDGAYHYAPGGQSALLVAQASLNAILATDDYLYLLGSSNTLYRAPIAGGVSTKLGINTVGNEAIYTFDFAGTDATRVFALTSFTHGAGFFTGGSYKLFGYPL